MTACQYNVEEIPPDAPNVYRTIEGGGALVPRQPRPFLQQLRFGKTRTVIFTEIQQLQGEWLEAADVEEYLLERGIRLRSSGPLRGRSSLSEITAPSDSSQVQHRQPANAHARPNWDQDASSLNDRVLTQRSQEPDGPADVNIVDRAPGYQHLDGGDWSVFGGKGHLSSSVHAGPNIIPANELRQVSASVSDQVSSQPPYLQDSKPVNIGVDIDKLVKTLAENATCLGLGPGIRRDDVDYAIRQSIVNLE
ncbi:hypothetical protein G7Z17_g1811 [Cylindrodendrum hubeiense]|uniref:Uncharacterized protein n=1 Tax=Cylindrodendrum hubeiense TaxID=595255 RepID=A0A9P5LLR2_9HYPO|nr:hypothetical protein G7Z17_g1811 [Cylindrodendrum hubeiense]